MLSSYRVLVRSGAILFLVCSLWLESGRGHDFPGLHPLAASFYWRDWANDVGPSPRSVEIVLRRKREVHDKQKNRSL